MNKRLLFSVLAIVLAAGFTVSAAQKDGDWTGWISDSHCAAKGEPKPDHGGCASSCVKNSGAKYVLYSASDKKVYALDAQDKAGALSGKHVKVSGTLDGDAIKVKTMEATGEQKGQEKKS